MDTDLTDSSGYPTTSFIVVVIVLLIIIFALVAWNYYNRKAIQENKLDIYTPPKAPQCFTNVCTGGTKQTNFKLTTDSDGYQTYNFCSINSPSTSFVQAVEKAAGYPDIPDNIPVATQQQIIDFAKFYNQEFVDTCGWS